MSGASGTLPSAAGFAFCSTVWQSWRLVGVGKCLSQGCVRAGADGDPALAPAAAVARHGMAGSGAPACGGTGQTCLCSAGPAEPVEPELPGSSPTAAPHPGQPVCPPACRQGGSRVPQQHPGAACRVLPAPRGSGALLAAAAAGNLPL